MKLKSKCNVPQLIPHDVRKNIQQVRFEYILFSHIAKIKRKVVVVVEKSSKEEEKTKPNKNKNLQQNMISLKGNSLSPNKKLKV